MKNGISALGGLALAVALGATGCASSHSKNTLPGIKSITSPNIQAKRESYSTPLATKDNAIGEFSHNQMKYALENLILYEMPVYAVTNSNFAANQLPFDIYVKTNTTKVIDKAARVLALEPREIYTPEKVLNSAGEDARRVTLSMSGKYAKKATIYAPNPANVSMQVDIANQDATQFGLTSMRIMGKEYYVVSVEQSKMNAADALHFYFLSKDRTVVRIDERNGEITLDSAQGIYRPKMQSGRSAPYVNHTLPVDKKGATTKSIE